jgi:hypothetical protein
MTPARLAEIRRYVQRLDQRRFVLTVEQRIIADLWAELPEVWDEGHDDAEFRPHWNNPYRAGAS